ncbi:endonuclease/exonuclease/phosphatase family protein [Flavimarina sp. Hel_I_48]|uniref:endonuclease/exonuclease/phosphatase family protein n=1 Tax=Flavimarina sp. Hel_I_48 TaxID=1392488 RepID=UPI0004DEED44|nr:endonuclease/exonuclease/phosphatase family protein [Flavimarina sp. Hel_I_48]
MTLKRGLFALGILAILLTLIPLIAADYWWIRIFDFPHTQLTAFTFIVIAFYFFRFDIRWKHDYLFVSIMLACFVYQINKIVPYTSLYPYEVLNAEHEDAQKHLSLFTSNVLQSNKERQPLIDELKSKDPDILLLCEANAKWLNDLRPYTSKNYSYRKEIPLDNTYGMALYSKMPLIDPTVHYIIDKEIPSIHTKLILKTGDTIQIYAIHPTPPMPQHNPKSSDRDAEMMIISHKSRQNKLPVIVMGDFNDVAWSNTTALFKASSTLLDPRIGRGFYNTFSAKSALMKWPLDHIFISPEFRIRKMAMGADINSDHYPSYAELSFEPKGKNEQLPEPPSKRQLKNVASQIEDYRDQND